MLFTNVDVGKGLTNGARGILLSREGQIICVLNHIFVGFLGQFSRFNFFEDVGIHWVEDEKFTVEEEDNVVAYRVMPPFARLGLENSQVPR